MKKNLLTLALSVAASVAASAQASYGEAIEMQVGQNSATIESELSDTAFFKYTAAEGMALTITANTGTMVAAQEIVAGGAAADTVDIDGVRTSDRETVYPAAQGRTIYICAIGVGEVGFTAAAEPAPGVGTGATADAPLQIVVGARQLLGTPFMKQGYSYVTYATYTATESGVLEFSITGTSGSVSVDGGPQQYLSYEQGTYTFSQAVEEGRTYSFTFTLYGAALVTTAMTHPEPGSIDMPFAMAEGSNTVPAAFGDYYYTYTPQMAGYASVSSGESLPGGQVLVYNGASSMQYGQVYAQSATGSYDVRFEVPYPGNTYYILVRKNEASAAAGAFSFAMEPYKAGDQESNPIAIAELPATLSTETAGGTKYYSVAVPAGETKFLSVSVETELASPATQVSLYPQGNQYMGTSANGSVRAQVSGGQAGQAYIIRITSYESQPIEFGVAFEEIAQGDVATNPLPAALGQNDISGQGTKYYSYTATLNGKLSVSATPTMGVSFPMSADQWAGNYQAAVSGVTYTIDCAAGTQYLIRLDNVQQGEAFTLAEREYQVGEGRDNPIPVEGGEYALGANVAAGLWISYTVAATGMLTIDSDVPYDPMASMSYYINDAQYPSAIATYEGSSTYYRAQVPVEQGDVVLVNLNLNAVHEGCKVTFAERGFEPGESLSNPLTLAVGQATAMPTASRTTPVWLKVRLAPGEATITPNAYMMAKLYTSLDEAGQDAGEYINWQYEYDADYNTTYYYTWTVETEGDYYIKVEQNTAPATITVSGTEPEPEPEPEPQPGETIATAIELDANGQTTVPQSSADEPVWCKVALQAGTMTITATENAVATWFAGRDAAEALNGTPVMFAPVVGEGSEGAYAWTASIAEAGEYYMLLEGSEAELTLTVESGVTNGIGSAAATQAAVSVSGRIVTVSAKEASVAIYGLAGSRVAGGEVSGSARFSLRPGVYIISVNGKATKLTIK